MTNTIMDESKYSHVIYYVLFNHDSRDYECHYVGMYGNHTFYLKEFSIINKLGTYSTKNLGTKIKLNIHSKECVELYLIDKNLIDEIYNEDLLIIEKHGKNDICKTELDANLVHQFDITTNDKVPEIESKFLDNGKIVLADENIIRCTHFGLDDIKNIIIYTKDNLQPKFVNNTLYINRNIKIIHFSTEICLLSPITDTVNVYGNARNIQSYIFKNYKLAKHTNYFAYYDGNEFHMNMFKKLEDDTLKDKNNSVSIVYQVNETGSIISFNVEDDISINESFSFDFFKDCRTYQEKKDKLIDFLKRGLITASIASMLITFITPNKAHQERLKSEIVELVGDKNKDAEIKDFKYGKFSDNTKFATDWKISENGIEHIKNYEKFSATPYYVTAYDKENDIRTIGYGHKIKSTDPIELQNATSITKEEAEELFRNDIAKFERLLRVQIVPKLNKKLQDPETMPQALVDVIISMMYNAGNGNFRNESINPFYTRLKNCRYDSQTGKINKQDYDFTIASIKTSLVLHNNEKMKGLENRRQTEYKMAASAK